MRALAACRAITLSNLLHPTKTMTRYASLSECQVQLHTGQQLRCHVLTCSDYRAWSGTSLVTGWLAVLHLISHDISTRHPLHLAPVSWYAAVWVIQTLSMARGTGVLPLPARHVAIHLPCDNFRHKKRLVLDLDDTRGNGSPALLRSDAAGYAWRRNKPIVFFGAVACRDS